jgi:hypothetical protein
VQGTTSATPAPPFARTNKKPFHTTAAIIDFFS